MRFWRNKNLDMIEGCRIKEVTLAGGGGDREVYDVAPLIQ